MMEKNHSVSVLLLLLVWALCCLTIAKAFAPLQEFRARASSSSCLLATRKIQVNQPPYIHSNYYHHPYQHQDEYVSTYNNEPDYYRRDDSAQVQRRREERRHDNVLRYPSTWEATPSYANTRNTERRQQQNDNRNGYNEPVWMDQRDGLMQQHQRDGRANVVRYPSPTQATHAPVRLQHPQQQQHQQQQAFVNHYNEAAWADQSVMPVNQQQQYHASKNVVRYPSPPTQASARQQKHHQYPQEEQAFVNEPVWMDHSSARHESVGVYPHPSMPRPTASSGSISTATARQVQLQHYTDNDKERVVAAGVGVGTLGWLAAGPVAAVALGFSAAFCAETVKEGHVVGDSARAVGTVALSAKEHAAEIDKKYHVVDSSIKAAEQAWETAKELDRQHKIVQKAKDVAIYGGTATVDFCKEHKLVEKSAKGIFKGACWIADRIAEGSLSSDDGAATGTQRNAKGSNDFTLESKTARTATNHV